MMFNGSHTKETKQKISKALMGGTRNNRGERNSMYGKHHSEEVKRKMSIIKKGVLKSKEIKERMSEGQRKRLVSGSYINGMYGKHHSEETKEKLRVASTGRLHTKEAKQRMSIIKKGILRSEETKRKMSRAKIKQWQDSEFAERSLKKIYAGMKTKPNKPERKLRRGLNKLFPGEYKYVGDGTIWMNKRNPDFININGQKKIIELFGDYWHGRERTGRTKRQEENQRIKHFAKYGYKTLIVWVSELKNLSKLKKRLIEFHKV